MTYKEYLDNCDDEFERAIIIVNLARSCPSYDGMTELGKKRKLKELLEREFVDAERKGGEANDNNRNSRCNPQ